jgi:hypothetical protein
LIAVAFLNAFIDCTSILLHFVTPCSSVRALQGTRSKSPRRSSRLSSR